MDTAQSRIFCAADFGYYSIVGEAVSNVQIDVLIVLFAGLASGY